MQQNQHEAGMLLDKWRPLVDYVGIGGFTNRAGSLDVSAFAGSSGPTEALRPMIPACVLPFREMNVWADGKAVLCCDDWNEEHVVGDLSRESLRDIWHGEALQRARDLHIRKRGADIGICGKCSMWREPSHGARLWS